MAYCLLGMDVRLLKVLNLANLIASILNSILSLIERKELKKAGSNEEKLKHATEALNALKKTRKAIHNANTDKSIADRLRSRYGIYK